MATTAPAVAVVTVGRDDILAPFSAAEKMAAKNHHVEPYKWVHFKGPEDEGSDEGFLEATNGHNTIRTRVQGVSATSAVDVYLPRRLGSVLKAMPEGPVQIEIGNEITVHGSAIGDTSYTLGRLADDPSNYPLSCGADVDWSDARYLDQDLVESLVEAARFTSGDTARQNLWSVLVKQAEGETVVGASDSYRMYVAKGVDAIDLGVGQFTLPSAAIWEMTKTFAGTLKMTWDDNRVYLHDGEGTYFATLRIHGDVPDFTGMVQGNVDKFPVQMEIPRQDMVNALNQVGVMGSGHGQVVALDMDAAGIQVELRSDDGKAQSVVSCPLPFPFGEDDSPVESARVGFNLDFLRDGFNLFSEDNVDLRYSGNPNRPIVLQSDNGMKQYMIAPVRIP